ncbi:hypothetical protein G7Z17_g5980 [Cylindrodendrum hubeiense]|uniref:DUF7907 domain-containing protein n=1 Tax=Cylindrodendrum hubeiense TaxID=595255 RepID=A0A9P5HAV0_9HYPO|nr:hypothetical protein G7Z17_g5980 [Cylindrodendrum hubeiense]
MIVPTILLGLLGLTAASPVASKPSYPATETSKGFKLVVNVTDPSKDFKPSIQNTFITSIHTGAGLALVGVIEGDGRIFYQNGTKKEQADSKATIITDGGTPLTPSGLKLTNDTDSKTLSTAHLDFGLGTPGVQLSSSKAWSLVLPETYLACNESLDYYQGQYFVTIKQARITKNKDGSTNRNIPKHCVPIRLFPECAELETLPEGSYSSHKYALDSRCYKDVSKINWRLYSP